MAQSCTNLAVMSAVTSLPWTAWAKIREIYERFFCLGASHVWRRSD